MNMKNINFIVYVESEGWVFTKMMYFSREVIRISVVCVLLLACFSNSVYCFHIWNVFGRDQRDFLTQFVHPQCIKQKHDKA